MSHCILLGKKKKLFTIIKVTGLIWSNYDSFYHVFWTAHSSATKLGLMIHHHKPECPVKKNELLHSWSRVKKSMSRCLLIPKHFLTKLGIVMHLHEPDCHAKKLICYFQGQGHSKGSYDQSMTVCTIYFQLLILLQINLVWWHIIISWIVSQKKKKEKDCIALL